MPTRWEKATCFFCCDVTVWKEIHKRNITNIFFLSSLKILYYLCFLLSQASGDSWILIIFRYLHLLFSLAYLSANSLQTPIFYFLTDSLLLSHSFSLSLALWLSHSKYISSCIDDDPPSFDLSPVIRDLFIFTLLISCTEWLYRQTKRLCVTSISSFPVQCLQKRKC